MSFKKDGYTIAKKAISLEMANVCFGYLITKKNVFDFLKRVSSNIKEQYDERIKQINVQLNNTQNKKIDATKNKFRFV